MMLERALMDEKRRECRKMKIIYGVNDERTQMANIRYLQSKYNTQMLL